MIDGIIIKGIGGFYYIKAEDKVYECKARGRFRKDKIIPVVGDKVKITIDPITDKGMIEEIMPRKTQLIRPCVANVSQAIIVFAIQNPEPNLSLLDRFLVTVEMEELDIVICFNKTDLESKVDVDNLQEIYSNAGYRVIKTSTKQQIGLEDLKEELKNQITVFAGPSGVGKSSLLNMIQSDLQLQVGEISNKNNRGKHTTRHVELMQLEFGGWVLDTPGFSSLEVENIDIGDLQYYFREFTPLIGSCKFNGCIHLNEPECAVKQSVSQNQISKLRYNTYIQLLGEIQKNRRY